MKIRKRGKTVSELYAERNKEKKPRCVKTFEEMTPEERQKVAKIKRFASALNRERLKRACINTIGYLEIENNMKGNKKNG